MARHPPPRDDRRDHGQRLARATILRHHAPRRAHVDQPRALRGRRVRWCRRLGPFSLHPAAVAAASLGGGNPLLHHSHLRRLQHRLRAHSRWPRELHASVRNVRLPGRATGGKNRRRISHRTVHVSGARGDRLLAAPLRAEGDLMAIRRYPRLRSILDHAVFLPLIFFALFPFYFMLLTSLKRDAELYDLTAIPFLIRQGIVTEHYSFLLRETLFGRWLWNSLLVSIVATATAVVIGTIAAYALARLRFRGAESFGLAVFITYLVPPSLLFLPLSQVVNALGLTDSIAALMVTYPTFLVPFCTWLLMGYFRTIPKAIEECAMLDGCNRFQTLLRILLPVAVPGVICAALFAFTLSWNEFLYSLVFVSPADLNTTTAGVVAELIRGDIYYWGGLMAGACIGSLPIVVAYVFFLDYYVSGLTAGAVK